MLLDICKIQKFQVSTRICLNRPLEFMLFDPLKDFQSSNCSVSAPFSRALLGLGLLPTIQAVQSSAWDRSHYVIWQYWLWNFQSGGAKLERFLHKNQGNY